jgi:ankyrin repeat protein
MILLIDEVAEVDDTNTWGRTALHAASWQGQEEAVTLLLEHGADPNKVDEHNRTPLFFACLGSTASLDASKVAADMLLTRLLRDGYNISQINMPTKSGRTPLREAAAHGFFKIVEVILGMLDSKDTDTVNRKDSRKGRNALHCAAFRGRADVVELLLQHGADVNMKDGPEGNGKTALQLCHDEWAVAGSSQHEATIAKLIDFDSTAAAKNRSLLETAAVNGSVLVLGKLLDAKADLNEPDQYGWTPLLLARQFKRTDADNFLSRRLAQIGMKPSKWNYAYDFDFSHVSEDGLGLEHPGGRRLCVLADHPVPAGLDSYYFEVEMIEDQSNSDDYPELAVGYCTSSANNLEFPGWRNIRAPNSHSWAYHGDDGNFYSSTGYKSKGKFEKYGPPDTVGCGINYKSQSIFFTRNGQRIGTQRKVSSDWTSLTIS